MSFNPYDFDAARWENARDELNGLALLQQDWDGEGALPVRPGLVATTHRLFDLAKRFAMSPPTYVYLTASGTVMAEWHEGDVAMIANVRQPDRAEVVYRKPGTKSWVETMPLHRPRHVS